MEIKVCTLEADVTCGCEHSRSSSKIKDIDLFDLIKTMNFV